MSTVTVSVSLALPANEGVVSFDGVFGWFRVTVGEAVLTTNVIALLLPAAFPSELGCVAIGRAARRDSAGLAPPELQPPPVPAAVAVETTVPWALAPS